MLRYAITDRSLFAGNEAEQQDALIRNAERWATQGINFVQIREKDLETGLLARLARRIIAAACSPGSETKTLINSRADIAVAVGADGVHLTSAPGELTPRQVRQLYAAAGLPKPIVSISCHSLDEVRRAAQQQVDAILFGPVFEKVVSGAVVTPGVGLDALRNACEIAETTDVYALGGVTRQNTPQCLAVGAAGIAAIRLFLL